MKKMIINNKPRPVKQTNTNSTGYSRRLSVAYGNVKSINENGTCNITLVTGFPANKIKIPSKIYPSKEPTIGGVDYPQIGAFVKIIHPEGDLNSGWIEPAEVDYTDDTVKSDLPEGTKILLGGWTQTYDQETGEVTFLNNSNEIKIDPANDIIEIYGTIKVARFDDTTQLVMSGIDIQALAVALLTTGGFVPASAPVPASTPVTFTDGKITSGSDKVKVG